MTSAKMSVDDQLCFALYRASRAVIRAYGPILDPLDLTYLQYQVLRILWDGDGHLVGELGEELRLDSATLTPLLKKMEAKGLLSRVRQATDERKVLVSLTSSGVRLRSHAERITSQFGACLGVNSASSVRFAELMKMRDALNDLADTLEKEDV